MKSARVIIELLHNFAQRVIWCHDKQDVNKLYAYYLKQLSLVSKEESFTFEQSIVVAQMLINLRDAELARMSSPTK